MDQGEEPQSETSPSSPRSFRGSPLGWALSLVILGAFPITMAVLSAVGGGESGGPALSPSPQQLLAVVGIELALFAVWFGVAFFFAKPSRGAFMLKWNHPFLTPLYGCLYFVALRAVLTVLILVALVSMVGFDGENLTEKAKEYRPNIEKLVDTDQLGQDPVYLVLNCTVVSFVMAGLREELWRVGMLVCLFALFPALDRNWWGRVGAVTLVAILFGLGHLVQGVGAAVMITFLGFGLGLIILWHRSIWEAVIAHGVFDASTFVLIFAVKRYAPDISIVWTWPWWG